MEPARLLLDIHSEAFDAVELLSLTLPLRYDQLDSGRDGRMAALVRKLRVPKLDAVDGVLGFLAKSNNEVVSDPVAEGKITSASAQQAVGMARRDAEAAQRRRFAAKRFMFGHTFDKPVDLDDAATLELPSAGGAGGGDAEMQEEFVRPTDRVYTSRLKQEDAVMRSAGRQQSPAGVKREEPYAYDDADEGQGSVVEQPARAAAAQHPLTRAFGYRTYSMKPRVQRPVFKQEHAADCRRKDRARGEQLREAQEMARRERRQREKQALLEARAAEERTVKPFELQMPHHPATFDSSRLQEYVRLLLPEETPIVVHRFKLLLNPSFNNEPAVLLNIASLSVCFVPEFADGAAVIKLSSGSAPTPTDLARLAS